MLLSERAYGGAVSSDHYPTHPKGSGTYGRDLPNEKIKSWSQEEQVLFDQIKSYPNTLFSPHVAGWTTESYLKINTVLIEKIRTLFHP